MHRATNRPPDRGIDRRDFTRLALGTLSAAALAGRAEAAAQKWPPGIKLCAQSPATPTDEQLLFLKQLGADYVSVGSPPELRTAEGSCRSRNATRTPASRCGTSATATSTTCRR